MSRVLTGCPLDTDGDGNCPIHPKGCPSELHAVLTRLCAAADAALHSRDQDTPPHGAKGYVRVPERNALRAAVDEARASLPAAAAMRGHILRALRNKLQADLPRRCGDGSNDYLDGVRAALGHAIDMLNLEIALAVNVTS